jgi:hypothetical protein
MSILKTLENCIKLIPSGLVKENIFYVELPKGAYETLRAECEAQYVLSSTAKVEDMGKGVSFYINYMGCKIIVVENYRALEAPDFYIAFKTNII